ncbi:MAG: hypothetical protein ACRDOU_26785 [Streptosporangiaceae bacterium]
MRITKVPGAVFADTLFLIGQAWLKRYAGDIDGAAADLAAAMKLVPLEAVETILFMIEAGELPEPAPGAAMDAWLEQCRQAGAGEFRLTLGQRSASERQVESTAEFLARLARIRAEAEGAAAPALPPKPLSLADEMRDMGLI